MLNQFPGLGILRGHSGDSLSLPHNVGKTQSLGLGSVSEFSQLQVWWLMLAIG